MKAVIATAIFVDGSDDFESVLSVFFFDFSFKNFLLSAARGGAIFLMNRLYQRIDLINLHIVCGLYTKYVHQQRVRLRVNEKTTLKKFEKQPMKKQL